MARKYFEETYYTETIENFNPTTWLEYGKAKIGLEGRTVKLVGVKCYGFKEKWHKPHAFSYGKHCKTNTQHGMKDGFVELRFSYTPVQPLAI